MQFGPPRNTAFDHAYCVIYREFTRWLTPCGSLHRCIQRISRRPIDELRRRLVARRDQLLVVLPDGRKSLIPAGWTDRDTTTANEGQALDAKQRSSLRRAELLHARELVASLRARADASRGRPAANPGTHRRAVADPG